MNFQIAAAAPFLRQFGGLIAAFFGHFAHIYIVRIRNFFHLFNQCIQVGRGLSEFVATAQNSLRLLQSATAIFHQRFLAAGHV